MMQIVGLNCVHQKKKKKKKDKKKIERNFLKEMHCFRMSLTYSFLYQNHAGA